MTHITETEGLIIFNKRIGFSDITIRFSSDYKGETLSLADEKAGIQISIPYEVVEKFVKKVRKTR